MDAIDKSRTEQQAQDKAHGPRLSPELNEFLHMMRSLESQFGGQPDQASAPRS